jgi:hypothetical protein
MTRRSDSESVDHAVINAAKRGSAGTAAPLDGTIDFPDDSDGCSSPTGEEVAEFIAPAMAAELRVAVYCKLIEAVSNGNYIAGFARIQPESEVLGLQLQVLNRLLVNRLPRGGCIG